MKIVDALPMPGEVDGARGDVDIHQPAGEHSVTFTCPVSALLPVHNPRL